MICKDGYETVSALRELTSQPSRRAVGEGERHSTACLGWDRGVCAGGASTLHRADSGLRSVPGGNSVPSKLVLMDDEYPARSASCWESGDELHRVCEPPEMTCKMLAGCCVPRRGSAALTDSQRVINPLPRG